VGADAERRRGAPRVAVAADADVLRRLFREYRASLGDAGEHLVGFDEEVAALPGGFDLVLVAGDLGCVALRRVHEHACEMKRLYVRPAARGTGAGRELILALIEHARAGGYTVMYLDTLPSMVAAGSLYRSLGFVETKRYNDNPAPGVRFMELQL